MDDLSVSSGKNSSDSRRRGWRCLPVTTLRQMDKQRKQTELWRRLSDTIVVLSLVDKGNGNETVSQLPLPMHARVGRGR
jgi:hypothetical protein